MNSKKLKQIKIENYIWLIYIGIIIISYISNYYEADYYKNNNIESKKKYQDLLIITFSILLVIYIYFFKSSFDDLKDLNSSDSEKKKEFVTLSTLGSFLVLISGVIFLYIAITDKNIDTEIAFN